MLIKRKLFPVLMVRKRVMKISSTNNDGITRNALSVRIGKSLLDTHTYAHTQGFSFAILSESFIVFSIFFPPRNARKVFHGTAATSTAICISNRIARASDDRKGQRQVFFAVKLGTHLRRASCRCFSLVWHPLAHIHMHTHTHMRAHRVDGRARWRGARCNAGCSAAAVALRTSAKAHAKTPVYVKRAKDSSVCGCSRTIFKR